MMSRFEDDGLQGLLGPLGPLESQGSPSLSGTPRPQALSGLQGYPGEFESVEIENIEFESFV